MKMKSMLMRGATAAVFAGLMTAAPGMAVAATVDANTPGATTEVTKTWEANDSAQLNSNETFNFSVTYDENDSVPAGTNALVAPTGVPSTFSLTTDWTQEGAVASTTIEALFANADFTAPGSYFYTIAETAGQNTNIQYDSKTYTVVVNVQWKDGSDQSQGTEITGIVVRDAAGEKVEGNIAFTNTANTEIGSLDVSKHVAGTAANTNDSFAFTLTLGGTAQGSYSYSVVDDGGNVVAGKGGTITAGTAATIELSHGQHIKIANLPVGTTWEVSENAAGYTPTVESTDAGSNDQASGTISTKGEADSAKFTNEKGFVPQTGITANSLPFVGVAAIAVAGAVTLVISRKHRAGEEF